MDASAQSRLSAILKVTLSKLAESKDNLVLLSEIAGWTDETPTSLGKLMAKTSLKSRWLRKQGVHGKGFSRLELSGLMAELESAAVPVSEEAPLRDWGCTDCFTVFESRERAPSCPHCESSATKIAVQSRAPALKSARTTRTDDTINDLCADYGLTDYRSADHTENALVPRPVIQSPTGPVMVANNTPQGADIGSVFGASPGAMSLNMAKGTGEARINPFRTMRDHIGEMSEGKFGLPRPKGTRIVGSERSPLPKAL